MDKMLYLIVCSDNGQNYVAERELSEMDRATTIADIAAGEWTNLSRVLELNSVEGICRDVTEDFAHTVMTKWANDGESLTAWQVDFVEQHVSIRVANSFRRVA